jgi:hypothetical protein
MVKLLLTIILVSSIFTDAIFDIKLGENIDEVLRVVAFEKFADKPIDVTYKALPEQKIHYIVLSQLPEVWILTLFYKSRKVPYSLDQQRVNDICFFFKAIEQCSLVWKSHSHIHTADQELEDNLKGVRTPGFIVEETRNIQFLE